MGRWLQNLSLLRFGTVAGPEQSAFCRPVRKMVSGRCLVAIFDAAQLEALVERLHVLEPYLMIPFTGAGARPPRTHGSGYLTHFI